MFLFMINNFGIWSFYQIFLSKYIETEAEELDQDKLPILLTNKYQSFEDAGARLGDLIKVKDLFKEFQKYLYEKKVA